MAQIYHPEPIPDKLKSFGWAVREVNGNDVEELSKTLKALPFEKINPSFIICTYYERKGISYMENEIKWHHGVPSETQFKLAIEELNSI